MLGKFVKPTSRDYWTLELDPDAPPGEVKKSYRRLIKAWHPDRFQQRSYLEQSQAEEKFKKIQEAYERIAAQWTPGQRIDRPGPREQGSLWARWPRAARRVVPPFERFGEKGKKALAKIAGLRLPAPFLSLLVFLLVFLAITVLGSLPFLEKFTDVSSLDAPPLSSNPPPFKEASRSASPPRATVRPPMASKAPGAGNEPFPPKDAWENPPQVHPRQRDFFTLGSTREEVLSIQGYPTRTHGETWEYDLSKVRFKGGRVVGYNNFDESLKVRLRPQGPPPQAISPFFSMGSGKDDVLRAMGTPTRVKGNRWYYGLSEIQFFDGRVAAFDNFYGDLKIRMATELPMVDGGGVVAIGSTMDEVLAARGTPHRVRGDLWSYGFARILFQDGRVRWISDPRGVLELPPSPAASRKPGQTSH